MKRIALLAALSVAACTTARPTVRRAAPATNATATTTTTVVAPDPGAATTPAELAATLTAIERALRDDSTTADRLPALGRAQDLAYRRIRQMPEWREAVASAVGADVRDAVVANLGAAAELVALTPPRTTLPEWNIRAPLPAADLRSFYAEGEARFGIPWMYLAAMHLVETRLGRIVGLSSAGAQGPMQFIPSTWAAYGEGDITSDHDAILGAARYLRASGGPDDMARALYRYNPSNRYVRAITAYAGVLAADERAYRGYYQWPVVVRMSTGDVVLEPPAP